MLKIIILVTIAISIIFVIYFLYYRKNKQLLLTNNHYPLSVEYDLDQILNIVNNINSVNSIYLTLSSQNINIILDNVSLEQVSKPYLSNNLQAFFFHNAIVINSFYIKDKLQNFVSTLHFQKSKEGINGIMLFLSLNDLQTENVKEFKNLHNYLKEVNQEIKIKLPIYFVITNLETIQYFSTFSKYLNESQEQSIFGITLKNLNATLNEEYFNSILENWFEEIEMLKQEMLLKIETYSSAQELIQFFYYIKQLKTSIIKALKHIFAYEVNENTFYLNSLSFVAQNNSKTIEIKDFFLSENYKTFFLNDLLEKKIFFERNLIKADFFSTKNQKKIQIINTVFWITVFFSFIYLIKFHYNMKEINNKYKNKINNCIELNKSIKTNSENKEQEINLLINELLEISEIEFNYNFIPTYWLSNFNEQYQIIFKKIINEYLINNIVEKINEKYQELNNIKNIEEEALTLNPMQHSSYKNLMHFCKNLEELQKYEQMLVEMKKTGNIEIFQQLILTFFGIHFKVQYNKNIMRQILKSQDINFNHLMESKHRTNLLFQNLVEQFVNQAFEINNLAKSTQNISDIIDKLYIQQKECSYEELTLLHSNIGKLSNVLIASDWILPSNQKQTVNELLNQLKKYNYLNSTVLANLETKLKTSFSNLIVNLNEFKLNNIGNVAYVIDNKIILSDNFLEFLSYLNLIFSNKNMQPIIFENFKSEENINIMWDTKLLNEIVENIKSFKKIQETTQYMEIKEKISAAALENLLKIVETKLNQAKTVYPIELKESFFVEMAQNYDNNFANIITILNFLKTHNHNLYYQLKEYQKNKSNQFLNLLIQDNNFNNLFDISIHYIKTDIINQKISLTYNLEEFNNNNKAKIEYYAKIVAEKVLNVLNEIQKLDNIALEDCAKTWIQIIQDVNNYKNKQNSFLKNLENSLLAFHSMDLNHFFKYQKVLSEKETTNFFINKEKHIFNLIENFLQNQSILKLKETYDNLSEFYVHNSSYFPLNNNGEFMPLSIANRLKLLIESNKNNLNLINLVPRNQTTYEYAFITQIFYLEKILDFIVNNQKILLKFKEHKSGEMFEENINLISVAKVKTNLEEQWIVPFGAEIIMENNIAFEFQISNITEICFKNKHNELSNKLTYRFNKIEFVKFLLNNTIIINNEQKLKFEFEAFDKFNKEIKIVLIVPFNIIINNEILKINSINLENIKNNTL